MIVACAVPILPALSRAETVTTVVESDRMVKPKSQLTPPENNWVAAIPDCPVSVDQVTSEMGETPKAVPFMTRVVNVVVKDPLAFRTGSVIVTTGGDP